MTIHLSRPDPTEAPWLRAEVSAEAHGMRVRLAGELDIATEDQFAALVGSLDRDGYHRLIVDLAEVQLCDARGLAALLSAHDLLEAAGGHLTLTGVPPLTREMLVITDLIDVFDLG